MHRPLFLIPILPALASFMPAQEPVPQRTPAQATADVRANYTKFEYRIRMRDGARMFTSVYIPKDVFSDGKTYPIVMTRTPYNVAPYGADAYRAGVGPSE